MPSPSSFIGLDSIILSRQLTWLARNGNPPFSLRTISPAISLKRDHLKRKDVLSLGGPNTFSAAVWMSRVVFQISFLRGELFVFRVAHLHCRWICQPAMFVYRTCLRTHLDLQGMLEPSPNTKLFHYIGRLIGILTIPI